MTRSTARARGVATWLAVVLLAGLVSGCAGQPPALAGAASGVAVRLPFELASPAALTASPKKVFAHYLPSFPISLDNAEPTRDYYATQYLSPTGEDGRHAAYGGLLRDRPAPRAPLRTPGWQLEDMTSEVRRAAGAGLDGFTVDVLSLSGDTWARVNLLFEAAPIVDPDFTLALMPDAAALEGIDADALADAMTGLARSPAAFRLPDGRVVVSPFDPEQLGVSFWQRFLARMKSLGIDVAFVPCFLDYQRNAGSFADISYGFADWGSRSPAANADLEAAIQDAHARGKVWMQPVSQQDERPSQGIYDEADNSENLRLMWQAAIDDGADWVQVVTWNDYSENTQVSPSANGGWAALDISSYYLDRFKTGAWPRIDRDGVYVSYRVQPAAAVPTGGQSQLMSLRSGSSPARDQVEVLTFLSAPATVQVVIGGVKQTYAAQAGVSARLFDLREGNHSVSVLRQGVPVASVATSIPTSARPPVQNLEYFYVSSTGAGT